MNSALAWSQFAQWASLPAIRSRLIEAAMKQPDDHLEGYMLRYWLRRPTTIDSPHLPASPADLASNAMRIHHILTKDNDRHLHDHPWQFRSIILSGWYREERLLPSGELQMFKRSAGDTYTCSRGDYHRILEISEDPLYTLCIIGKKESSWGFLVNGQHIDSHEYLDY